jgi:hypothetical protein
MKLPKAKRLARIAAAKARGWDWFFLSDVEKIARRYWSAPFRHHLSDP